MGPVLSPPGIFVCSFIENCLLLPCHDVSALRAFALEAGHAALVWFRLPTLRANAIPGRPGCCGTTGTSASAAPLTLPLTTARTHSAFFTAARTHSSSSSVHGICLPFTIIHPSETPATPLAATRHCIGSIFQAAFEPGLDNLVQVAGHKGNDSNAITGNHRAQGPGYGAANQRPDTQIYQPANLPYGKILRQRFLLPACDLSNLGFNNMNLPCRIKDRCDSILPICESCFHHFTIGPAQ
jgi:hypothetical protein